MAFKVWIWTKRHLFLMFTLLPLLVVVGIINCTNHTTRLYLAAIGYVELSRVHTHAVFLKSIPLSVPFCRLSFYMPVAYCGQQQP